MRISAMLPRLKIDSKEISNLWGGASVYGYNSIRKLGWDEDITTLAVQSILQLSQNIASVHLVGELNVKILCQATGISEERVHRYSQDPVNSFRAFHMAKSDTDSVFLVVDAPTINDPKLNTTLSPAAVAIMLSENDTVVFENYDGSNEYTPLLQDHVLHPAVDVLRVRTQSKHLKEDYSPVLSVFNLRNIRRLKPQPSTLAQAECGFSGLATPFLELAYLIKGGKSKIQLLSSDTLLTGSLTIDSKNSEVFINTSARSMSYSQFMQREQLPLDPGSIAQGAYISTPVYESNIEARYRLRSRKCQNCDNIEFPPRRQCKVCGHQTELGPLLSPIGEIYAFTHILKGAAPTEFDYQQLMEGEYGVAIVAFPEGPKVISQLSDVDTSTLKIGDKVKMVFRKIYTQNGSPRYGYKFTSLQ